LPSNRLLDIADSGTCVRLNTRRQGDHCDNRNLGCFRTFLHSHAVFWVDDRTSSEGSEFAGDQCWDPAVIIWVAVFEIERATTSFVNH
jgi:hypothetical protein